MCACGAQQLNRVLRIAAKHAILMHRSGLEVRKRARGAHVSLCRLKAKWNCQVQGESLGKLPARHKNQRGGQNIELERGCNILPSSSENVMPIWMTRRMSTFILRHWYLRQDENFKSR